MNVRCRDVVHTVCSCRGFPYRWGDGGERGRFLRVRRNKYAYKTHNIYFKHVSFTFNTPPMSYNISYDDVVYIVSNIYILSLTTRVMYTIIARVKTIYSRALSFIGSYASLSHNI